MLDQRELIETNDWSDIIIFDACRYDYFQKHYGKYFTGKLSKVWNGGVGWTFDWYKRTFRKKYDVVLFTPLPVIRTKRFSDNKLVQFLLNPHPFLKVVGHRKIGAGPLDFTPEFVNEAIQKSDWKGRRIIHYFTPHPPFPNMPCTEGIGKAGKVQQKLKNGEITLKDLHNGYVSNLKIAFEAAVDIMPYLGKRVIITADHGECLGDCGMFFHGRRFKHEHIVNVPWFEVSE